VRFDVEFEQEDDGRWLAEVASLPGILAYGMTRDEAQARVQALALRVVAERLEHGEVGPHLLDISFRAASAPVPTAKGLETLEALDRLQRSVGLTSEDATKWSKRLRAERRMTSLRRERR
jgi:predicted RNase H-like HicB family nuclease